MDELNVDEYDFVPDTREGIVTLHTSGNGYWGKTAKAVRVTGFAIWTNGEYTQVNATYNTDDWNPNVDGLIYTDPTFLEELKAYFAAQGVDVSELDYSEHGMQDENFVHLEAGEAFARTAIANLPAEWIEQEDEYDE